MNAQELLTREHPKTVSYLANVVDNPEFQKACIFAICELDTDLIPGAKALVIQLERLSGKQTPRTIAHRTFKRASDQLE